jgi:hypothetical protein
MTYTFNFRETHMRKDFKGDSIVIKFSGGDANAGNGGNGSNYGDIINKPTMTLNTYNKVEGADVHNNTGDKVYQKAYWDADAEAKDHSKAYAKSYGDQESEHKGDNKGGDVYANTDATQTNTVMADQSIHVWAGIAGDGGDDAKAYGGDVNIDLGSHLV